METDETSSAEDHARNIVDKSLEIFSTVGYIFNTTRNHIYHNHLCMGAWLLASGGSNSAKTMTTTTFIAEDTKSKGAATGRGTDPMNTSMGGRVNLFKVQQDHSLTLLNELFEALKLDVRAGYEHKAPEPAGFDILGEYTSLQRIVRVLDTTPMRQILTEAYYECNRNPIAATNSMGKYQCYFLQNWPNQIRNISQ